MASTGSAASIETDGSATRQRRVSQVNKTPRRLSSFITGRRESVESTPLSYQMVPQEKLHHAEIYRWVGHAPILKTPSLNFTVSTFGFGFGSGSVVTAADLLSHALFLSQSLSQSLLLCLYVCAPATHHPPSTIHHPPSPAESADGYSRA